MNIVGLGNAGCQIAKNFEQYGQYKTFCIDTENKDYKNYVSIKPQTRHEEYEKNYKRLALARCKGNTIFIMSGVGDVSGAALRILDQLKSNKIDIVYIKPDVTQLSEQQVLKETLCFGVLQQYTRSALFNSMFIISNVSVEQVLGSVSLKNYWRDINNVISSTIHMSNVFKHTEPLLTTMSRKRETVRIGTFGVVNSETGKEKLFYDIQNTRLKNYFYGLSEKTLDEDKNVLSDIRSFVEENKEDRLDVGFSIFSTSYEKDYVYSQHFASFIQEETII
tara:strand:+ start:9820 stop:10653 length:834 start_codon:yes stop_codon:yes gene_type:complete